ncbi:uncharacterized protein CCR75_002136 [Bremia lactucae]|uniref:Uncharacterized protein n=1 Tax=Bremia lactucae TaxID=4779 RepID=A0A976FE43_BRELC|nr:hypothetical protein CCR75_002136 [Bremia lactucae]
MPATIAWEFGSNLIPTIERLVGVSPANGGIALAKHTFRHCILVWEYQAKQGKLPASFSVELRA